MTSGLGEMWDELASQVGGRRFLVVLAGALGLVLCDLAARASRDVCLPDVLMTAPIPMLLASFLAIELGRGGPAVSLGALLGYSCLAALRALNPLAHCIHRSGGLKAAICRACSSPPVYLPIGGLPPHAKGSTLVVAAILLIPFLVVAAIPAAVAYAGTRRVPRLLLLMYAIALLADSLACSACRDWRPIHEGYLWLGIPVVSLDLILSLLCLRGARSGAGGRLLLSALTFYAVVGSLRA